jgi:hypothetical protein
MMRSISVATVALVVGACGGSQATSGSEAPASAAPEESAEKSAAADGESAEPEPASAEATSNEFPSDCAKAGDVCTPPVSFAKRLCSDTYPGVALYLFRKGTPWTRGYLRGKTQAWSAFGGASEQVQLEFDEEVLVLLHRKVQEGGMQVSGAGGGYEALRWDGTCVTLAAEELTMSKPPDAKTPKVEIKRLDDKQQEALRADAGIDEAYKTRRKECKGQMTGTVSLKCIKADTKLSKLIVDFVRSGGELPKPERLP